MSDPTTDYFKLFNEVQKMQKDLTEYEALCLADNVIDPIEQSILDEMKAGIQKALTRLEELKTQRPLPTASERVEQWIKDNWSPQLTEEQAVAGVHKDIDSVLNPDMIKRMYQQVAASKQPTTTPTGSSGKTGTIDLTPDTSAFFEQEVKRAEEQKKAAKIWLKTYLNGARSEDDAVRAIQQQYNALSEEEARKLVQEVVKEMNILLAPNGLGSKNGVLVEYNGKSAYIDFPKLKHKFNHGCAKFTLSASASGKLTFSVELQVGKKSYITIEAKGKLKVDKLVKGGGKILDGKPSDAPNPLAFSSAGVYWHSVPGAKAFDTPLGMKADLERKGTELEAALGKFKKNPRDMATAQKVILAAEALYKTMTNHAKLLKKSPNFTLGAEYLLLDGDPTGQNKNAPANHVFGITLTWHF